MTTLPAENIQSLTSAPPYRTDVPLAYLPDSCQRYQGMGLNMDPDFQRGHVWNTTQKQRWIEFLLKGGKGPDILLNHPGWMRSYKGPFVVVDGKQRLSACLEFLNGSLAVFPGLNGRKEGWTAPEIERKALSRPSIGIAVNNLPTRKDVLRWYLELNAGQVAHTTEELALVESLLQNEENQ